MSDARTDFFSSSAKTAPPPSRDDFFAGKLDTSEPKKPPNFSAPYAYFDPEVRRAAGVKDSDVTPLQEIPSGFNRGVMALAGIPMDAATDASNLLGAGYGTGASLLTGKPAGEFFTPDEKQDVPFTGDWFSQKLDALTTSLGMGPVTQPIRPDDPAHRLIFNTAAGIPSGLAGGGGSVAPTIAGSFAGAAAGELGADPATQATVSLLASHGASKLMTPDAPSMVREEKQESAQEKLNKAASSQSMGAAGAAVDLQKLSPALRAEVEKAVVKTGGAVNEQALARQIQADSLPVKVPMSEGQVLGDGRLISEERNARGKTPGAVEAFESQNKALTENLRVFRDSAGENVFSTNPVEHGDTLISRYKALDAERSAQVDAKYQALRDAAGGDFPVDTQTLLSNVRGALKKAMASSKAPADAMGALEEVATSGKMTLEQFEDLRTNLARTARSSSDGNERYAAGVIRRQIEEMPLLPGAEKLKWLADEARSAARARFQAIESDPAYKAAVEDSVPPDRFVQKFVTGGTRDNVAKLAEAMKGDEAASQTLKVAAIDHLRQAAGIDGSYNGKFSQFGYNKALRALEPKLGYLVDPQLAEHMQNLGDVARYSQFQPEGSYVNNSNTFVASAADKAATLAENAINYAVPGMGIGTMARERIEARAAAKKVKKSWGPGAGLTRLSDLPKVKK